MTSFGCGAMRRVVAAACILRLGRGDSGSESALPDAKDDAADRACESEAAVNDGAGPRACLSGPPPLPWAGFDADRSLTVREVAGKGLGVFALRDIPNATCLGEYEGKVSRRFK